MKKYRSGIKQNYFILAFCILTIILYILQRQFADSAHKLFEEIKENIFNGLGQSAVNMCVVNIDMDKISKKNWSETITDYLVTGLILPGDVYYSNQYVDNSIILPEYSDQKIVEDNTQHENEETSTPETEPESENQSTTPEPESEAAINMPEEGSIMEAAAGVYSMDNLLDYNYVLRNFYVVPSVTSLPPDILNLSQITSVDLRITKDNTAPQILIFHTHGHETFADSEGNGKTIVDAGSYLTDILTSQYGYNVMHITDSFDVVNGVLDRSEAYTYANSRLDQVLKENPSIQVVIDLHRDGVPEDKHLVTEINGKTTAKIMLFNGISYTNEQGKIDYLYNPYLTENLAMTYKMYLISKMTYPDFVRCIYISGYRYCLHHMPRSMLIEAGAQTNTYEEVYNAMEPLAAMLDRELTQN